MCACKCIYCIHSLYDHLQGLSQRHRLAVEEVEVQLVAKVGGGLQQSVELLLYHLVLLFGHLDRRTEGWTRAHTHTNRMEFNKSNGKPVTQTP